jgi:hypothetical protein
MVKTVTAAPVMDFSDLEKTLQAATSELSLFKAIVNAPFMQLPPAAFLFLGIMVLVQANPKTGMVDRVALSNTELAKNTTDVSVVPFEDIKIPLKDEENILSQTIRKQKPHDTTDWRYLFTPAMEAEEARMNQASGGIAYSAVYPLASRDGGALIFSYYQYLQNIGDGQKDFMQRYSKLADKYLAITY